MLTLSLKQLQDPAFTSGMVKLNNNRELDRVTAYRVGRICEAAHRALSKLDGREKEVHEKFAAIDEKTKKPLYDEKGQLVYNAPDAASKADAEFQKVLEETKVDIKAHKLDFNSLKNLSGLELTAVAFICDNVPDIA